MQNVAFSPVHGVRLELTAVKDLMSGLLPAMPWTLLFWVMRLCLCFRHGQNLIMTVEGVERESKAPGDFYNLDTHGHYFIGKLELKNSLHSLQSFQRLDSTH